MSQDGGIRKVRNGAKSCVECRKRKTRCTWPTDGNGRTAQEQGSCRNCVAHGRDCVPQLLQPSDSDAARPTARDRISRLEREVASLTSVVMERDAPPLHGQGRAAENPEIPRDDAELGLDSVVIEDALPPSHLQLLFNSHSISAQDSEKNASARPTNRLLDECMRKARATLRPLIPRREEIAVIATYASHWMSLYHALFPPISAIRTAEQLITSYETMQDVDVHPVALAMFLLSVAITAQQKPNDGNQFTIGGGSDVENFVDNVSRAVETTVVASYNLSGTVEGLEATMLFVRLQLGRGNLQTMWLTLRRAIALAELIGLPRAKYLAEHIGTRIGTSMSSAETEQDRAALRAKADLWEAMCATDRNSSMMFNLPACTASYPFLLNKSIMLEGKVSPQAYNLQLSDICAKIHEIDESYVLGLTDNEAYEKVLKADRQSRTLAASAPKTWWQELEQRSLADQVVQFWHHYLLARIHLRPAMTEDTHDQFAYSRIVCREACGNAARLFLLFRLSLPSGFFVCRVVDVQAFTAVTSLLLLSHSPWPEQKLRASGSAKDTSALDLVEQVVACFKLVCDRAGSDLASEAIGALTSIKALFNGSQDSVHANTLKIRVPLLGEICITSPRKERSNLKVPNRAEDGICHSGSLKVPWTNDTGLETTNYYSKDSEGIQPFDQWSFEIDSSLAWFPELEFYQ